VNIRAQRMEPKAMNIQLIIMS